MSDDRDRLAMGLQREVDAWRARAEEAEARIARVEAIDWAAEINWFDGSAHYLDAERAVRAALAEPVGEPPRCTPTEEGELGVAYCTRCIAPDGTPVSWPCPRSLVGDPQPPHLRDVRRLG